MSTHVSDAVLCRMYSATFNEEFGLLWEKSGGNVSALERETCHIQALRNIASLGEAVLGPIVFDERKGK